MEEDMKAIIEKEFEKLLRIPVLLFGSVKDGKKEIIKRLMDNQAKEERLEVTYDIMLDKIAKEHLIKELNEKMFNEAKFSEETEKQLFGMTYRIMKAADRDKQKELIVLERLDTQRLESENKINELIKKTLIIEVMFTKKKNKQNRKRLE